ncbi:hypothetical protein IG631_11574 [Alternaria alternata]|nr:hypothetical protein IG631_11574 [Alternaria alternata]
MPSDTPSVLTSNAWTGSSSTTSLLMTNDSFTHGITVEDGAGALHPTCQVEPSRLTWLAVEKVRADRASRSGRPRELTECAGKTGGKTGGKGDAQVKTPKSHSAKAGLQVSSCPIRVIAQPPPRAYLRTPHKRTTR